jgi:hypothetical protein
MKLVYLCSKYRAVAGTEARRFDESVSSLGSLQTDLRGTRSDSCIWSEFAVEDLRASDLFKVRPIVCREKLDMTSGSQVSALHGYSSDLRR